ncbi:MAG: S-layer homology domain-containing protein [Clostridia bacterium]|nr:S-layer homology domain-containing protein [Clostridia bacterium]
MKKLISVLLTAIMIVSVCMTAPPVSAAKSGFSDVADDRWSAASIKYAVDKGYMKGVGGDKFDPEGSLTRAMVATVLWRREGEPAPAAPSGFTDVPSNEWYTDAVAWAKETGVVKGITDKTFEPDGLITREQLATMLFRFSSTAPVAVPERADLAPFSDDEKVSEWANEPLGWAVEAGLIKGTDGNRLAPDGNATREQFAAIIERYDDNFILKYNEPVLFSQYTEKPYPLVGNADVYVAVDGNDSNPGTFEEPLASFAGAVAKVREIKAEKTAGDIVVAFKAGNYGPVELTLGPEDAGSENQRIVYCRYGDGDVVFDNGATLTESDFLPLEDGEKAMFSDRAVGKIKKLDIGSVLGTVPSYDDFAVFSDTDICSVARFPNRYPDGSEQFLSVAETYDPDNLRIVNKYVANRFAKYDGSVFPEMRIYGYLVRGYRKDTFEIESYDSENELLRVGKSSSGEFGGRLREEWRDVDGEGIRMIVLNVPYELDAEGEYWLDHETGTLYLYDPHGDYHVPMAHGEDRIRGVVVYDTGDGYPAESGYCAIYAEDTGFITFRGLRFTNNVDNFIMGYRTSGFEIDRCRFDCDNGRDMILFEKSLPGQPLGLKITDSEFDLCVGRHVYVFDDADGPDRFTDRSDVLVDNCLFAHSNLSFDAEAALNLHCCSGGTVSHNRFENCHRYAVMFSGSCDVVVEYNDFHSAMTNSDDGGVTRSSSDVLGNNVVRYNFYNRVSGGIAGRMAHYCDNGDCGSEFYSNLLYYAGAVGYSGPAGRDNTLRDNVMIGNGTSVFCGSFTVEGGDGKIVVGNGEEGLIYSLRDQWLRAFGYCETVPGYAEALRERRPGVDSLILDFDRAGEKDFILAPTNSFIGNLFINSDAAALIDFRELAERYVTNENNEGYTFDQNPVFVNPTRGDYRIREGAGFPDIRFEKIGRY